MYAGDLPRLTKADTSKSTCGDLAFSRPRTVCGHSSAKVYGDFPKMERRRHALKETRKVSRILSSFLILLPSWKQNRALS